MNELALRPGTRRASSRCRLLHAAGNLLWLARLAAAATGALVLNAAAQTPPFPDRPLTIVVPYPVGGPVDIVGRVVAEALGRELGQPVIVENRTGAGGTLGTQRVARAAPDGYTLLVTAQTPVTIAHHFEPKPAYDATRDLQPVARLTATPVLILGSGARPERTLSELFERGRAESKGLNYGAPGLGNEMHLIWEMVRMNAGVAATAIPYQGTGPGLGDLTAGRIDAMVTAPASVRVLIAEGKVRPLAVVADTRLPDFPDVPTLAESGIRLDGVPVPWLGLFAPAGTPATITGRLHRALEAVAASGPYRERMQRFGMDPTVVGPDAFGVEVARYRTQWDAVIAGAGIRFGN